MMEEFSAFSYFHDLKNDMENKYNWVNKFVIGLSGGVDSAVVSAAVIRIFGKEKVFLVSMPSENTSQLTYDCIDKFSREFNVKVHENNIRKLYENILENLKDNISGIDHDSDIMKQNIQARIRGTMLYNISNAIPRSIVLGTGNRVEDTLGYFTIFGDGIHGYHPLFQLWKTEVIELGKYLGVPEEILKRKPHAELGGNCISDEEHFGMTFEDIEYHMDYFMKNGKMLVYNTDTMKLLTTMEGNKFKLKGIMYPNIFPDRDKVLKQYLSNEV